VKAVSVGDGALIVVPTLNLKEELASEEPNSCVWDVKPFSLKGLQAGASCRFQKLALVLCMWL
jgi:hypothetical protein